MTLRVATWNVNGIRAREAQFLDWLERERPDVVCLQEIKASPDKLSERDLNAVGETVAELVLALALEPQS